MSSPTSPNPNNSDTTSKRRRTGGRRKSIPQQISPSTSPVSDEIVFINKHATSEALTALVAGFPADNLTEDEIEASVVSSVGGLEQINYILIRNHILSTWRQNVNNWLYKDKFLNIIPPQYHTLLDSAYNYLLHHGFINFGVAPSIKEKISNDNPKKGTVIIVGSGLSGLAAARQLMSFGFKVIVLEGRKRCGGRVYTKLLTQEESGKLANADLGGSVLTGTLGNPLAILAKQLGATLHKVRDKCPLYRVDGSSVDPELDTKVENAFNRVLEKASTLRQCMGDVAMDVSLGAALETFRQVYGEAVTDEEMSLYNWHLGNLEYANAGLLSDLSLAYWDQDDPYDMGGDHCFMPGGNVRLVEALAEDVPIVYDKTVNTIRYGGDGVQVVAGSQVYEGDMVLCTVPLGVLKKGTIKFVPELPQKKIDCIKRLGFGLLNKVAMLFPHVFWGKELDTFGHLVEDKSRRGEFFLFYSYATVAGGPLLIALVAGEVAHSFEDMDVTTTIDCVYKILVDIFKPQGIDVPRPLQVVCTRWGRDQFSYGAYSNVAVGSSGDDYDILAESVGEGRLFFAGEATMRRYPATMHGAFLSGLREASNIAFHANARSHNLKVEKNLSKNTQLCAADLADLFREPDVEFGSISVIFCKKNTDHESTVIVKVDLGSMRERSDGNEASEGEQHQQVLLNKPSALQFNQQKKLNVYTLLSRQQAMELREVRGGDELRLNFLCDKLGVKLIGRRGLGPAADSVIAAIKAERGTSRIANQKILREKPPISLKNTTYYSNK